MKEAAAASEPESGREAIAEILKISGGRMALTGIRDLLVARKHPAGTWAGPVLIRVLDALVAEGVLERITNEPPRVLYQLGQGEPARPAPATPRRPYGRGQVELAVKEALRAGPKTQTEIEALTGASYPAVHDALQRLGRRGEAVPPPIGTRGKPWSLPGQMPPAALPETPVADPALPKDKLMLAMLEAVFSDMLQSIRSRLKKAA